MVDEEMRYPGRGSSYIWVGVELGLGTCRGGGWVRGHISERDGSRCLGRGVGWLLVSIT